MTTKQRVVGIIQARMNSQRLPGKVIADLLGQPLLSVLLKRVCQAQALDEIIVATGNIPENKPIIELAKHMNFNVFMGSEDDVLGRYLSAAQESNADVIVRLTADNPLVCPRIIDQTVINFLSNDLDFCEAKPIINGSEIEVFSYSSLFVCCQRAKDSQHREHVTLYMKEHPDLFKTGRYLPPHELQRPDVIIGVDTKADLERLRKLIHELDALPEAIDIQTVVECFDLLLSKDKITA